ncbi:MAG: DUF6588 family protein [Bacteroidota bacterium]
MKSFAHRLGVLVVAVVLMGTVARSQDVGSQLSKMGLDAAKGWTSPLLAGWGAGLNSAFYHSADLHDILGFDVGVKVMLAGFKDEDKFYSFQMPASISYSSGPITKTYNRGTDYPATVNAPTVAGPEGDVSVYVNEPFAPGGKVEVMRLPGGLNLSGAPIAAPQLNIGLPFGLEVMGRFIPTVKLSDAGKVNFVGFGLRYDIDQWLPLFPVDIAVHFMTQKFNFKDSSDNNLISASAMAYGVEVSKKLFILTVYGGFQLEKASFTVGPYTAKVQQGGTTQTITVRDFTVDSPNSSRVTFGVRLLLLFINVHAEYSLAKTQVAAVGVGITIR